MAFTAEDLADKFGVYDGGNPTGWQGNALAPNPSLDAARTVGRVAGHVVETAPAPDTTSVPGVAFYTSPSRGFSYALPTETM